MYKHIIFYKYTLWMFAVSMSLVKQVIRMYSEIINKKLMRGSLGTSQRGRARFKCPFNNVYLKILCTRSPKFITAWLLNLAYNKKVVNVARGQCAVPQIPGPWLAGQVQVSFYFPLNRGAWHVIADWRGKEEVCGSCWGGGGGGGGG